YRHDLARPLGMDIPICQVINRMRQQVVVPQFGIEASRPLWPMHGHDQSAFESSREALRVFDRLNLAQLIGQVFQRHAEPSGNGLSIELLGRARRAAGDSLDSGIAASCRLRLRHMSRMPSTSPLNPEGPPCSGRPSRKCDFRFFAAILATVSPLNGAGWSTVALGSVAGQVVEPVL